MQIPLPALRPFAHDGRLYRAYNQVIAAGIGYLFAAPLTTVSGRLADLVDGCPVPWWELATVLDEMPGDAPFAFVPEEARPVLVTAAQLAPAGWRYRPITLSQGGGRVALLTHDDTGARLAVVEETPC